MSKVICANCSTALKPYQTKYCSNKCQKEHEYIKYIIDWRAGKLSGQRGTNTKNFSRHVVRYLYEKYNSQCSSCGWSTPHPDTGKPPLEIDHIDGKADNNTEDNLRLLCPNCHALTPTHRNRNIGNGRLWRKRKYMIQ